MSGCDTFDAPVFTFLRVRVGDRVSKQNLSQVTSSRVNRQTDWQILRMPAIHTDIIYNVSPRTNRRTRTNPHGHDDDDDTDDYDYQKKTLYKYYWLQQRSGVVRTTSCITVRSGRRAGRALYATVLLRDGTGRDGIGEYSVVHA